MSRNVLKEYLIKLGFEVDDAGAEQAQRSADEVGEHIQKSSKQSSDELDRMAKTAIRVFKVVLASKAVKHIKSFAKEMMALDEEIAKNAKQLKKTTEESRAYTTALKAMGKTMAEINANKDLKETFKTLEALGETMALPAVQEGMTNIKTLKNGFLELKVVGSYAMQWIMQKTQEYAQGPMNDILNGMHSVRDWAVNQMPKIGASVGKAFANIIQLFVSAGKAIWALIKYIDGLPKNVKIAGAVILGVIAMIKSKVARITFVITLITLLIDDLVTYMEGGKSVLGAFWGPFLDFVNKIKPSVEKLFQYFSEGLSTIAGWINTAAPYVEAFITNFVDGINALLDALGPHGRKVLLMAAAAVAAFILVMNANPITLVVTAVVSLIAAIGWLAKSGNWQKIVDKAKEIWEKVAGWFTQAVEDIKAAWAAVGEWFSGIWSKIKGVFRGVAGWFRKVFAQAVERITESWENITSFFTGIWETIQNDPTLKGIYSTLAFPFKLAIAVIKGIFNGVVNFFVGIWGLITGEKSLSDVMEGIAGPFKNAWAEISAAWSGVSEFFSGVWSGIKGVFRGVGGWFNRTFSKGVTWIKTAWEDVSGFFSGIWTDITTNETLTGIAASISGWFSQAWTDVQAVWQGAVSWFQGIWDGVTGIFSTDITPFEEFQKGMQIISDTMNNLSANGSGTWGSAQFTNQLRNSLNVLGLTKEKIDEIVTAFEAMDPGEQSTFISKLATMGEEGYNAFLEEWDAAESANPVEMPKTETTLSVETEGADEAESTVDETKQHAEALMTALESTDTTASEAMGSVSKVSAEAANAILDAMGSLENPISVVFESIRTIVMEACGSISGDFDGVASAASSAFDSAASNAKSAWSGVAGWFSTQVTKIKASLNSIPRSISVSVTTTGPKMSQGGIVSQETHATIGEDGKEYVIPVTKPGRAKPLIEAAMRDLGMTPDSYAYANKMLGGSNASPGYASGAGGASVVNNTLNSPVTYNVTGTNPNSIAKAVEMKQDQYIRNLKGVFA